MRQNSISYPGERPATRADIVEQPGYTGKHYFVVNYSGRQLTVHAADETAAIFWAAKRWGYSFKRPEYHQMASVAKLGYQPKNPVSLSDADRAEVEAFLEKVDADDDVQNVYVGLAG